MFHVEHLAENSVSSPFKMPFYRVPPAFLFPNLSRRNSVPVKVTAPLRQIKPKPGQLGISDAVELFEAGGTPNTNIDSGEAFNLWVDKTHPNFIPRTKRLGNLYGLLPKKIEDFLEERKLQREIEKEKTVEEP